MASMIMAFFKNESGATAIEYALIAMMVSIALIGGATSTGGTLGNTFNSISDSF